MLTSGAVAGRAQMEFGVAFEQTLRQFPERVQILAHQEHRFRADAFGGHKLVGRLANALCQHRQLARCRQLRRSGLLLQLQGRHGVGNFQQIGRLPVDQPQGGTSLQQDLLLRHDNRRILVGTLHQRNNLFQFALVGRTQCVQVQLRVTRFQAVHRLGQNAGTLCHVGKRLHHAQQRLGNRLGQTLRLHQRLPGGAELLRRCVGPAERQHGDGGEHQQRQRQHDGQQTLVAQNGCAAQRRQRHHSARRRRGRRRLSCQYGCGW